MKTYLRLATLVVALGVSLGLKASAAEDPMENYYGNTLICAAAQTGEDLCHTWFFRDGTFITFDASGGHKGRYTVSPLRPGGKVFLCQYWDTSNMEVPPELARPFPGANSNMKMLCKNNDYRTTCTRVDVTTLKDPEDIRLANRSMGERFHEGMCYPYVKHEVGDVWFEDDDPLPGQLGKDKVFLISGHR